MAARLTAAEVAVPARDEVAATEHQGDRAGAQRQRGELGPELLGRRLRLVQPGHRRLGDLVGDLAVDDERVPDVAAFDHVRRDVHPVEEGQARVADVEVLARLGQAQRPVHDRGRGGFDEVATDRGADQQANVGTGYARFGQRLLPGQGGRVGDRRGRAPHASLADAGNLLQQPGPDPEALQCGLQATHELGRGQPHGRVDVHDRRDTHVLVAHRSILARPALGLVRRCSRSARGRVYAGMTCGSSHGW